jgi:hypothetical protein
MTMMVGFRMTVPPQALAALDKRTALFFHFKADSFKNFEAYLHFTVVPNTKNLRYCQGSEIKPNPLTVLGL